MRRLIVDNLETRTVYGNAVADFLGIVYLITNTVTGEVYVGQTMNGLSERFRNHCIQEKSTLFPIIAKYGSANFIISILDVCYSAADLTKSEHYFIAEYNKTHKLYNIQLDNKKAEQTKAKLQLLRSGTKLVQFPKPMKTLRKGTSLRGVDKEKPVIGTHLDTKETIELRSMSCDSRFDPRLISACCKGKRQSHRRYSWRLK